jgi:high-affinity iron transporter
MSLHNNRKRELLQSEREKNGKVGLLWGMGFWDSRRSIGKGSRLCCSSRVTDSGWATTQCCPACYWCPVFWVVAILTFVAHRKLPYKKMMVLTGLMLAVVLLVMVGEQAQEMQLAHWLPITEISILAKVIPTWMGLWFS